MSASSPFAPCLPSAELTFTRRAATTCSELLSISERQQSVHSERHRTNGSMSSVTR